MKTQKNKSKVKSNRQKGFLAKFKQLSQPTKILVALTFVLVGTLAGTYGYSKWQEKSLMAQAGSYARVYDRSGFQIYVCKTEGRVRAFYVKPAHVKAKSQTFGYSGNIKSLSTTGTGALQSNSWWGGVISISEVSTPTNDGWYLPRIYNYVDGKVHTPGYVAMFFTPWC